VTGTTEVGRDKLCLLSRSNTREEEESKGVAGGGDGGDGGGGGGDCCGGDEDEVEDDEDKDDRDGTEVDDDDDDDDDDDNPGVSTVVCLTAAGFGFFFSLFPDIFEELFIASGVFVSACVVVDLVPATSASM
jgi:hypothetical protein